MPIVQVQMLDGRSAEVKERLIREISVLVSEILETPLENVRVILQDVPWENWGVAGESIRKTRGQV